MHLVALVQKKLGTHLPPKQLILEKNKEINFAANENKNKGINRFVRFFFFYNVTPFSKQETIQSQGEGLAMS